MAHQGNQGGDPHGRRYYNENRSHCRGGCFVFLSPSRQEKPQAARPDPASSAAARDSIRASLLASGRLLGLLQQDPLQALAALQAPSRPAERSQTKLNEPSIAELQKRRLQARQDGDFQLADQLRHQLMEAGVTVADGRACLPIAPPAPANPSHHHG